MLSWIASPYLKGHKVTWKWCIRLYNHDQLTRSRFTYELMAMIKVKHPSFTPTPTIGIIIISLIHCSWKSYHPTIDFSLLKFHSYFCPLAMLGNHIVLHIYLRLCWSIDLSGICVCQLFCSHVINNQSSVVVEYMRTTNSSAANVEYYTTYCI
jgi:hypothetical protein